MKKLLIFAMIFCITVLTGCDDGVDRILYPSTSGAELYYDTYPEVKNRIKREDVKRSSNYNDLFLTEGVEKGMTLEEVLYTEPREAVLDISTASEVFFMPKAEGGTPLTEWINQCSLKYTFTRDGLVEQYEIVNSKTNNSYMEYLFVMRALSLKYGECTTEIYKDGDNIINNAKIKEDYKDINNIINFYEDCFANENMGIISQWVHDDFIITVNFTSPRMCSVTYELTDMKEETKIVEE